MQNLTNKINGFLNAAISTTVLMVCVGSFLALFPTLSLEITRWIFIIALVLVLFQSPSAFMLSSPA